MTMMTSHPGAKMSNHTQPPAEIAQAAWQAAGIKPKSFGQYKRWWITWEEWCDAECINPLAATNDDFEAFVADQELNAHMRAKYRGLLFQPYRSVGKTNPARRPTSQSKAYIDECAPILKRFQSWCKANNSSYLPARNQDVVAFLTELAKTYSHSYLKQASTAIGRIHIDAGYTPPSREPEVTLCPETPQGNAQATRYRHQLRRKPRPTNSAMDRLVPTTQIRTGRRNRRTISPVLTATGHWALRRRPEEVPIRDRPHVRRPLDHSQPANTSTHRRHPHRRRTKSRARCRQADNSRGDPVDTSHRNPVKWSHSTAISPTKGASASRSLWHTPTSPTLPC